ncbi:hypothetical protein L1987_65196 [Smallanthus sonchifolius]|uniref:Uncharacterized protein n=1 Tax=Smallanthus sonchifolius TaxID=185202 RepID=A0ACB9BU01_9ASTR|nr:hypothetical protein L1987_65196 [Smallanthus sonchifolius]
MILGRNSPLATFRVHEPLIGENESGHGSPGGLDQKAESLVHANYEGHADDTTEAWLKLTHKGTSGRTGNLGSPIKELFIKTYLPEIGACKPGISFILRR